MGKDLARRIKKNSEEFYMLYEVGKELGLGNNILSFLLLSAIEEMAKYFVEVLLSKCGNPTLRRNVRSRIYNEHAVKYKIFLAVYHTVQGPSDLGTRLKEIDELTSKWLSIRKRYLINVSHAEVLPEDLNEIEKYYLSYEGMERVILGLSGEESCGLLVTLADAVIGSERS